MFSGSKTSCTEWMRSALWVTYLQAKNTFCNRKIRSVDGTENSLVEALHTFLRFSHDDENAGLGCWSADPLLIKELRLIGHNWWRIVLVGGSIFLKIRQILDYLMVRILYSILLHANLKWWASPSCWKVQSTPNSIKQQWP